MASTNVETVTSFADKAKLALSLVLLLGALVGFYVLSAQGIWVQWGVLLACLTVGIVVFLTSIHGRELIGFSKEAYREVHKVVWPTRKEATQMTLYVFGFVFIMALMLWFTDKTLEWVFYDLILGWKK
jgi:preprotein translocase subunit SecE